MLSASKPQPGVVRDRPSRFRRDFKSAARAARASSSVDSEKSIQIHSGSRLAFGVLSRTSLLLATVFGRDAIEDSVDERQRLSITTQYQLRLMTSLQARALKERDDFVLLTCRDGDTVTGVLTVSRGLSAAGAINYRDAEIFRDARVFSLCNMAVKEGYRRRGIATSMLRSAEAHVLKTCSDERTSIVVVLSCEKYNEDAQRLYEEVGYRLDDSWEDPRWLESIERGAVDVSRRVLMFKQLQL